MRPTLIALAPAVVLMAGFAGSQSAAASTDPFVSLGLHFVPFSDVTLDAPSERASDDGNGFGARLEVGGPLFVYGEYQQARHSISNSTFLNLSSTKVDGDASDTRLGMAFRSRLDNGYLLAAAEYVGIDFELDGTREVNEQGIGVHLGGGFNLAESATLYGQLGFLSLDDLDGQELRFGLQGNLGQGASLFGEYRMLSVSGKGRDYDLNDIRVGVRFGF
jgi:hypothetical protein